MKAADRPSFVDVARIIVKDSRALVWMPARLNFCAGMIIAARRDEESQPSFKDAKDAAANVEQAASLLIRLLGGEASNNRAYPEFPLFRLIYPGDMRDFSVGNQTDLIEGVRDLQSRAQRLKRDLSKKRAVGEGRGAIRTRDPGAPAGAGARVMTV